MAKRNGRAARGGKKSATNAAADSAASGKDAADAGDAAPRDALAAVRQALADRGVTAEEVLAEICYTLAYDFVHVVPPDERPVDLPDVQLPRVPRGLTSNLFRRFVERGWTVSAETADRMDDPGLTELEWIDAFVSGPRAARLAAVITALDLAVHVAVREVADQKCEAHEAGQPDPHPHLQFVVGSTTQLMIRPTGDPRVCVGSDGADGGRNDRVGPPAGRLAPWTDKDDTWN
jgi:hypothetical protein